MDLPYKQISPHSTGSYGWAAQGPRIISPVPSFLLLHSLLGRHMAFSPQQAWEPGHSTLFSQFLPSYPQHVRTVTALARGRRTRSADARTGADLIVAGGAGVRQRELGRGGCALVRRCSHQTIEVVTGDSGKRGETPVADSRILV